MKKFKEINDKNDPKMPLSLKNYILLLAGLIVIILGFVLMAGGGSDSPDEFNYAMFSRASPDTEISPRTVKWKPFKLSSWASSRA